MEKRDQKLSYSRKALKLYTGKEIQTSQTAVVKTFEMMENVIITDEQGEKVQGQYITIYVRVRDDLSKSLTRYPAVSPDKYIQHKRFQRM